MKQVIAIGFFLVWTNALAQKQNNIWCLGDSAGIDFNGAVPIPLISSMDTRGSCVSIADTLGDLLFYANTRAATIGNTTLVYNKLHQLMANGNNIVGEGWYHELIIIPKPGEDSVYYLFTIGVTGSSMQGLYYSIIDLRINNGLGAVSTKNIQLKSFEQVDCVSAIKNGNGRDWWIVFRKSQFPGGSNKDYYSYLVSPSSISNVMVQSVGSLNSTGLAKLSFSPKGNKMLFTNGWDLIELYDFDRCTGVISNARTINPQGTSVFYNTWGSEFSPSGDLIYVSTSDTVSYLYQYNLNDSNPQATRDTIWSTNYPQYTGGDLKRAPDGKIYFSCAYDNQIIFNYPYPDSIYNMYNMNLSVINQPDSPGAACNFQPYSFYLGGKRTYWGLPNNPDYDMPRDSGSVCDTVWSGLTPSPSPRGEAAVLYLTYISSWDKLFINAEHLKGTTYTLTVTDMMGRIIYKEKSGQSSPSGVGGSVGGYFTKDLDCTAFGNGLYIVSLVTNKEMLTKKFVKN